MGRVRAAHITLVVLIQGDIVLRILYVTDSLMAGGIESQLVDLVTRLDRTKFDPHIACLYGPTEHDLHFAPQLAAAGIPLHALDLRLTLLDKAKAVQRIGAVARSLRPQLIQAENYHSNLLTRMAWPLLPPTQLVGTVRAELTAKQLRYERLSYRFCSHFVASAAFLKPMLEAGAGIPSQRIVIVPNAIDVSRFTIPKDPHLRQQIAPGVRRVFVSIGRISHQKTIHLIAEAFGALKRQNRLPADCRLFIVGPVHDAPMQVLLEEAIRRDDLGEIVRQCGASQVPEDYFHASDVSILFSELEGLPLVALESLAAGRPVIISEEANAAQVIEHNQTGWVVRTGDVLQLAETLHTVLALPDQELARMRERCLADVQKYSLTALVETYSHLYETWCATPRSSRWC